MKKVILLIGLLSLFGCKKESPNFTNLDFETLCSEMKSGFCNWDVSYQVKTEILPIEDNDNHVLSMTIADGVGFIEQEFEFAATEIEKILSFSVNIKTENLEGKGAGLNLAVYKPDGAPIDFVSMGYGDYSFVKGNTSWTSYKIETVLPSEAIKVRIGCIAYGKGKAHFDDAMVTVTPLKDRKHSPLAEDYISAAIDSIKLHSLRKDSVDFDQLKRKALLIAGDAKIPEDNYLATRFLLSSMEDHHSFFMTANERTLWEGNDGDNDEVVADILLSQAQKKGRYGYISVPGFHGNDSALKKTFADTLQKQLRELYASNIEGWIVDLRSNDGGNMHPMLAGLEPLFSSDTLGFLVNVHGEKEAWGRNELFKKEDPESYVEVEHPVSFEKQLPMAVLYGSATGSSGEIVIISFIGNYKTKSFGQPSFGLTTGNGEFEMPDGSYLFLASTHMADRNGTIYSKRVTPDVVFEKDESNPNLEIEKAIDWLDNITNN
ncbi:MAG: S41 family peptidase [Bacteroidota bacterium]